VENKVKILIFLDVAPGVVVERDFRRYIGLATGFLFDQHFIMCIVEDGSSQVPRVVVVELDGWEDGRLGSKRDVPFS